MADDRIDPGEGVLDLTEVTLRDLDKIDKAHLKEEISALLRRTDDGSEPLAGFNNRI